MATSQIGDGFDPARLKQSFIVQSSWHMVCKLAWELGRYRDNRGRLDNGFRAWNGAVTAWHVRDWLVADCNAEPTLWTALSGQAGEPVSDAETLRKFAFRECSWLSFCQTIANAGKHSKAEGYSANVDLRTELRIVTPDDEWHEHYIECCGGRVEAEELLMHVLDFWGTLHRKIGHAER